MHDRHATCDIAGAMMRLQRGYVQTTSPEQTAVRAPEIGHFFRAFISMLVALGVYVLGRAIVDLPAVKFDYRLPILAVLMMASGRFAIKVPGRAATVGVSEVFVFGTILLFGTSAATVIVALEGIGLALTQRRQPLYRALFNVAEPAVSTWSAGTMFVAVSSMLRSMFGVFRSGRP